MQTGRKQGSELQGCVIQVGTQNLQHNLQATGLQRHWERRVGGGELLEQPERSRVERLAHWVPVHLRRPNTHLKLQLTSALCKCADLQKVFSNPLGLDNPN